MSTNPSENFSINQTYPMPPFEEDQTTESKTTAMQTEDAPLLGIKPEQDEKDEYYQEKSSLWASLVSMASVVFNIMNTTIGAGMVALAFTIKSAGMGLGTIIMLSLAFFSFITIQLLLRSGDKERQFTFKSLGVRAFSKNAGVIFEAVIFLQTFGVCTMYVIICGDYLPPIFAQYLGEDSILANKFFTCALIILFVELPICLFRKIEFLGYTSFVAIASVVYVVVLIFVLFIQKATSETGLRTDKFKYFSTDPIEVMLIIPTYFYAFGCHVTLLPIYKELKNRSVKKMSGLIIINFIIVLSLYSVIAYMGYMTFAEKEDPWPDNVLLLLDPTKVYTVVAKVLVALLVMFSFPLLFFATRNSIEEMFFSNKKFSWIRWTVETIFLCSLIYVTGMFVPDITTVFGIVGATAGVCVYYVFPLVIFIKLEKEWWKRILGIVLIILALCLGGVAMFATIYRIVNRYTH